MPAMFGSLAILCFLSLAAAAQSKCSDQHLTKDLNYQTIKGFNNGSLDLYLGLRYGSESKQKSFALICPFERQYIPWQRRIGSNYLMTQRTTSKYLSFSAAQPEKRSDGRLISLFFFRYERSIFPATARGPSCWQLSGGLAPGQSPPAYAPGSEDCLLLK
jgi:hypothetical protein